MNRDRPGKDLRLVEIFEEILYTYIIHKVWNHAKKDISLQMINEVYLASLERSAVWHDSVPLICTSVVPEAPNIATFSISSASGAWFSFKAGQFLRLVPPVSGEIVNRINTISSPPSRPLSLSVTVKAHEGSIGTRRMLDNFRPGMAINAKGPDGLFLLPELWLRLQD